MSGSARGRWANCPPYGAPTLLLRLYRVVTALILPFAYRSVANKLRAQGVATKRLHERMGHASLPRPDGPLVWFHGASVGESLSVLSLITAMGKHLPGHNFLITSGTASSADLIAKRLPPRTRHQFAPLDAPGPVNRFYAHWRPVAGIFVESELWPLLLMGGRAAGARLALLNARLSPRSVRRWRKRPETARHLLDLFDLMLSQNRQSADNLVSMGANPGKVEVGRNLKATAAALPVDRGLLSEMRRALHGRRFWIASSTHPGEEAVVLRAHRTLVQRFPDLCLLLIPRHPERGGAVAAATSQAGFSLARRSSDAALKPDTQVYLADTLGETGTWYALADFVFLGGSLKDIGGHNPFEPALAGAGVITGPYVGNFAETYAPLIASGGAVEVTDDARLGAAVAHWLTDAKALNAARAAAVEFAQSQQAGLAHVVERLCSALDLDTPDA